MWGLRRNLSRELVLFSVASISILAGASFNVQGYSGETGLVAMLAGLFAFAAGILHRRWWLAAVLALVALALHATKAWLVSTRLVGLNLTGMVGLNPTGMLGLNLTGMMGLALGGGLASVAYTRVTEAIGRRVAELEQLASRLEEQRRIFLAATEESLLQSDDVIEITAYTARASGAGFCCYYLASADGNQFRPQLPGVGFDLTRPPSLSRVAGLQDPIFEALDAGTDLCLESEEQMLAHRRLLPPSFQARNLLIVPLPMGDRVGGFVMLGNRPGGFTPDVRRLVATLAARAGASLSAGRQPVAVDGHSPPMGTIFDEAMGTANRTLDQVLARVLELAREKIECDAARVALFDPEGRFTMVGSPAPPESVIGTPLQAVLGEGRTVLREMVTSADGLFSGLRSPVEGGMGAEALIPVGSRPCVGAICLGRHGGHAFTERDLPLLADLGRAAGRTAQGQEVFTEPEGVPEVHSDEEPVLELLLSWTGRLAEAEVGFLALLEDGGLRVRAQGGLTPEAADQMARGAAADICARALESGEPQMEHGPPPEGAPGHFHPHAVLCLPIGLPAHPLGVVFLANFRPQHGFTGEHRRLASSLAGVSGPSLLAPDSA